MNELVFLSDTTFAKKMDALLSVLKEESGVWLKVLGRYETVALLDSEVPNPTPGDTYSVGTEAPYDIYMYSAKDGWVNHGHLQGVKGDDATINGVTALTLALTGGLTGGLTEDGVFTISAANLIAANAGAHNAIYRGAFLGTSVTDEQYAAIAAGTFDDLYIGDYWTINGVNWRIAAFDYYLKCGDTSCKKHHVVIVPDTCLYTAQMHNTDSGEFESGAEANTTAGGYVGSDMYKTNLEQAKTTIKAAFSGHVLSHRVYLTNAVTEGHPSAGAWCDSEVELMNEQMVYGGAICMPTSNGSKVYTNYRVEKSQLPLFALDPSWITIRAAYWLRDVVSVYYFAFVSNYGDANAFPASSLFGVRPAFCIS